MQRGALFQYEMIGYLITSHSFQKKNRLVIVLRFFLFWIFTRFGDNFINTTRERTEFVILQ